MRLPGKAKWKFSALAFAIPFVGMLMVMLVSQYRPFGKYSMLYSDMYHQYYPFFVAFRRALRSGDSLLYSWNVGMGMDYLGLVSYYLASPLNLLSVFIPESVLLDYFSFLVPIKLGLASLFFSLFLRYIFRKNDLSVSIFSAFYGLCAWALGYQWNVMWLDTFALLPLVVLGTVCLIREKKFILYTLTLFLSVYANYYIGFFTCIFVALVFFCYEICRFRGWKCFFADLGRIAFFSLLAIGMTAVLSLPTLQALQTTQSGVNQFPKGFRLNIASENTFLGLLNAMRAVVGNMGGGLEPTFKEGLPNLYCGVGTVLLSVLYLLSDDIRLRDKICGVLLLLFFNVSFIIRQLDYIWHGFHFTNMIPYRFSFLYSFVLLYMAYRAWLVRRNFDPLQVVAAFFLSAAVLCCSGNLLDTTPWRIFGLSLNVPVYLIYNIVFLLLYGIVLLYGSVLSAQKGGDTEETTARERSLSKYRRKGVRLFFLGIVCVELIATLTAFGLYFPGTSVTNYPRGKENAASMIRYMHEKEADTLFFRAETTHSQTLNDGALNGYNGVSTFTSSANVRITEFMKALGYGAKNTYNRYCFEESSPVSNLFLGLKYMIEREGRDRSSSMFEEVHHYGNVSILRNTAYLPLGFLAQKQVAELNFGSDRSAFSFQNILFSMTTGLDEDVWHRVDGTNLSVLGEGVDIESVTSAGYCSYSSRNSSANLIYSFVADQAGFACVHLNLPKRNDFTVSVNGEELYRETISLPQMLAVQDVQPGDVIDIRIICAAGEKSTMTVTLSILDDALFRQGYDILAASTLELTQFRNTYVEGTIDCNREGLLYTSIPQDGNWTAEVDGKPAQIILVGECMIGLELTEGFHRVSFTYRNEAFSLGWKISAACFLCFGILVQFVYKPDWSSLFRRSSGRYEKRR